MSSAIYLKIRNNPKFNELVSRRGRFAWTMSAVVMVIYFVFIMIVGFAPKLLAVPLGEGFTLTWAIPVGVTIVVLFWIFTAMYVRRANAEFDAISADIVNEAIK